MYSISRNTPSTTARAYARPYSSRAVLCNAAGATIRRVGRCRRSSVLDGDDVWELYADASVGENIYGLHAGLDDADDLFDVVVNLTANAFVANLAEAVTQDWGLNLSMPSSLSGYDGNNMIATITLIASEAA